MQMIVQRPTKNGQRRLAQPKPAPVPDAGMAYESAR